jgi:hypothetical protein
VTEENGDLTMHLTIADYPDKSKFYLQPAFRHRMFVWDSVLVLLDIIIYAATLVRRWAHLPAISIFLVTLGVLGLVGLWHGGLRAQRQVYRLFETGRFEKPEVHSPMNTLLYVAAHMTDWGIFAAAVSVGACLEALAELSTSAVR